MLLLEMEYLHLSFMREGPRGGGGGGVAYTNEP